MPAIQDRDWEIIERFSAGNNSAFEELMTRYEGNVYGFLVRMCGCPEGAKVSNLQKQ